MSPEDFHTDNQKATSEDIPAPETAERAGYNPVEDISSLAHLLPAAADQLIAIKASPVTTHYVHPDYPHLYIKASAIEQVGTRADDQQRRYDAYRNLNVEGLTVLPFTHVSDTDTLYIVTQKLNGESLATLLPAHPELAERYDKVAARLLDHLSSLRGKDIYIPFDVFGANQYMWGTPSGQDSDPQITFVDIESSGDGLTENGTELVEGRDFVSFLNVVAYQIIADEELSGRQLAATRDSLARQLELLRQTDSTGSVPEYINDIERAMRTGDKGILEY